MSADPNLSTYELASVAAVPAADSTLTLPGEWQRAGASAHAPVACGRISVGPKEAAPVVFGVSIVASTHAGFTLTF